MGEEDLALGVVIGVLVGIPLGIGLLWTFTHPTSKTYSPQKPSHQPASQVPAYVNEETWTWIDWKGRERKITVRRVVKALV